MAEQAKIQKRGPMLEDVWGAKRTLFLNFFFQKSITKFDLKTNL
jgi:hypothetical protein